MTLEELKERIKKDKVVYYACKDSAIQTIDFGKVCIYGLTDQNIIVEYKGILEIDRIFDNEEDALECAEFSNVTRVDKLKLPTWNEISEKLGDITFYDNRHRLYTIKILPNQILICDWEDTRIFTGYSRTRKHYNAARRIAVKIFKGEEIK